MWWVTFYVSPIIIGVMLAFGLIGLIKSGTLSYIRDYLVRIITIAMLWAGTIEQIAKNGHVIEAMVKFIKTV